MEESTAEFAREELLVEAPPLKAIVKVTVACKTDLGRVRENNEDKFEYFIPEDESQLARRGMVFIVCDGMGGHSAGQIASELTAKTFIDVYLNHHAEQPETAAESAVIAANRYVLDVGNAVPNRRGMGTTLSALILVQGRAIAVHVGDSRIYRLRSGLLSQITRDHTWVEENLANGTLTPEDVVNHPYSHVLTRAIGVEDGILPDIESREIEPNDTFLLCSDGLINHVADDAIAEMLSLAPSQAAWRLVNSALQDGGRDNCTVLIVRIDSIEPPGTI